MRSAARAAILLSIATFTSGACARAGSDATVTRPDTLVVFDAASLAAPMRAAMDSFADGAHVVLQEEHGASLELARRIMELGRVPDVVALADAEVFPQLLVPRAATWYAEFARNRMVVAYTDRSRGASEMSSDAWHRVLLRSDVRVGRSDPALAPAGYRALLMYRLAELSYKEPGLASRLEARTPPSLIRNNAAELAALLSAGELDYIVDYESVARAQGLRFVNLPAEIDLGDAAHASDYARASVMVARQRDTTVVRGAPILYGLTIPRAAPHPDVARRFAQFLLGARGRAIFTRAHVDMLDAPLTHGDAAPDLTAVQTP